MDEAVVCGIVGITFRTPVSDRGLRAAGRDALRYRGPDDADEWWSADGCVGFGHRRLAIIDLFPSAHQPMQDTSGELSIVFNGETYNFADLCRELTTRSYAFCSHSDMVLAKHRNTP